jgi:isoaspartyl peptidase/L-asparaginase-like protein (Ntn-hydrolase superfamily)
MRFLGSKRSVDYIEQGLDAQQATAQTVEYIAAKLPQTQVGVIAIDHNGNVGASCNTGGMPVAWLTDDGSIEVRMKP